MMRQEPRKTVLSLEVAHDAQENGARCARKAEVEGCLGNLRTMRRYSAHDAQEMKEVVFSDLDQWVDDTSAGA
ncbi:hypothetical protein L195_g038164 [Trifolium pratense]|uniref:Uncharacterized protein n=1 Tax=Trifolium pratense TaxID=57577 RepID=A0A2K3LUD0_TRIPR|nr:hypothetical protein L195_g038164 [Trifolium pratense]